MNKKVHNQIVSFIWSIADDVLRDVFVRGKYRDIILPFVVLRRLDALLVPTKDKVLEATDFMTKENIDFPTFKSEYLPLPPIDEQTSIGAYLDRKAKQIDEFVSKKERMIELLEEQKKAIINQVVSKGINQKAKFKDSGVEWLGKIPEHWEVKKLKYVAFANPSNIDKKSEDKEESILLCNYVDVYRNDFISSELNFMKATASKNQIKKFLLKKGDVLATKDSETPDDIGNPALVVEDFNNVVCGYHLTHVKPKEINGDFLFRFFQTQYVKSYFAISANGVTRFGLGVDKFNSVQVFCPPKEEQSRITEFLENELKIRNNIIIKAHTEITKIKEYKESLITNIVTGKLKAPACDRDVTERIKNVKYELN
ncbi:MAG: restriction endonuclease subunit S [Melioribacteraceae bacterium]|nr:restriction endonuclease subunit S [Melioribacteraceae bacterium]